VTGLIITTVGFIIATRMFGIKYDQVAFSHGRIGVAILVLIYSQVRPKDCILLIQINVVMLLE
jgi:hypothetical protein